MARLEREKQLLESTKQINYTDKWTKTIKTKESRPFLQRAQERVHKMWDRQAVNEKKRRNKIQDERLNCTFRPQIDDKARSIGPRSVKDWYKWDQDREYKRSQRKQEQIDQEMSHCRGKFRSPETRRQKERELKTRNKYC